MRNKLIIVNISIKDQKGFTLLEILLVIATIGILAAIVIVAINPGRQLAQARNAERSQDISTLHKALEQFLIDRGSYPTGLTTDYQEVCATGTLLSTDSLGSVDCTGLLDLRVLVPTYIAAIPEDPLGIGSGDSADGIGYQVRVSDNGRVSLGVMSSEENNIIAINDSWYSSLEIPIQQTLTSWTLINAASVASVSDYFVVTDAQGQQFSGIALDLTSVDLSKKYRFSVLMRQGTANRGTIRMIKNSSPWGGVSNNGFELTNDWQRYSVIITPQDFVTHGIQSNQLRLEIKAGTHTLANEGNIHVLQPRLEEMTD